MKKGILLISLGLMFCIVGLKVAPVYALPFYNITNNTPGDAAIGEAQLFVDVTTNPKFYNQVFFTFRNNGPEDCSIAQIYFDGFSEYWEAYGIMILINTYSTEGVNFPGPPNPSNLPGGKNVDFEAEFGLGADSPAPKNGVNPGETLDISLLFDGPSLTNPFPFDDLLANLGTGDTRIGMHVIGFASGGSESFISSVPIPEPSTMLLLGVGLIGLAGIGRKKFVKK